MSGGKGGGGSTYVTPPDPLAVSGTDFIFNRYNQLTPFSSLNYYAPGVRPPTSPQVGFNTDFLTPTAGDLFRQPGGQTGGGPTPGTPQAQMLGNVGSPTMQAQAAGGAAPTGAGQSSGPVQPIGGARPSNVIDATRGRAGKGSQGPQYPTGTGGGTLPNPGQNVYLPGWNSPGQVANFGGLSNVTAVQSLAPDLMALENARLSQSANILAEGLRRQNEVAGGALPSLVSSLNTQGLGSGQTGVSGIPGLTANPEQFRQDTINAMYQLGSEPLNRDFSRNLETVEQRLANQGLALGGEAASRVMSDFAREDAQARQNLALQSVLAGGQEASRGIGDINQIRSQGFAEQGQTFGQTEAQRQARLTEQVQNAALAQNSRVAGLNELNVLLGLPQVGAPPLQSFFQSSPTGVTDAFGLNLGGQQANAQMNAAMKGSQLGALGSLGSAGILAGIR